MSLSCKACGHEWSQDLLKDGPMVVADFTRHIRALTCPECKAGYHSIQMGFGANHNAKAPPRGREISLKD